MPAAMVHSGKKHLTSSFIEASLSIRMAKAVKSPAGRRLLQLAFTYGEVVEIEIGPTPEIHLHSIFSSSKAVFV